MAISGRVTPECHRRRERAPASPEWAGRRNQAGGWTWRRLPEIRGAGYLHAPLAAAEHRVVVSWEGQRAPIMLRVYAGDSEVAVVELSPVRALELAKELVEPAVQSIKTNQWGPNWPG